MLFMRGNWLRALPVYHYLAVWFAFVSPATAQMAQWSSVPLPANWTDVRRQSELGHAASAVLDLIGFGALIASVIVWTVEVTSQEHGAAEIRRNDAPAAAREAE